MGDLQAAYEARGERYVVRLEFRREWSGSEERPGFEEWRVRINKAPHPLARLAGDMGYGDRVAWGGWPNRDLIEDSVQNAAIYYDLPSGSREEIMGLLRQTLAESRRAKENPFPLPEEFLDYVFSQVRAAERWDELVSLSPMAFLLQNWSVLGGISRKTGVPVEGLLDRLKVRTYRAWQDMPTLTIRWDSIMVPERALGSHYQGHIELKGWREDSPDFWWVLQHELTHYGQYLLSIILNKPIPRKHILSAGWRRPFREQDAKRHDPAWLAQFSPEDRERLWLLAPVEFYPLVEGLIPEIEEKKLPWRDVAKMPMLEGLRYGARNLKKVLVPTMEAISGPLPADPAQRKVMELMAAGVKGEQWAGPLYTKKVLLKILRPLFGEHESLKAIDSLLRQGLIWWAVAPGRPRVYEKALTELSTRTGARARGNARRRRSG